MILPGHIALGILAHTYLHVDLTTTLVASLSPDLVDKTFSHVLECTPSSRYVMHNALAWAMTTGLVYALGGPGRAKAWGVGYMAHLICDGDRMPWFFPFRRYDFTRMGNLDDFIAGLFGTAKGRRNLAFELLLLALALILWRGSSQEAKLRKDENAKRANPRYGR